MSRVQSGAATAILLGTLLALGAPAAAQTPFKIGASGGKNTVAVPLYYAVDSGLFKKNGLDAQIVELSDDVTAVQGLIAGEYDMLYTGGASGIIAIAKGADIKLVNSFAPWTDYQFIAGPQIKTLKDMEGKILGVSKVGSISYLAPVFALKKEGIDIDKITYLAVGFDGPRGQAVAAAKIDGAAVNGLVATQVTKADPKVHIIYDVGTAFQNSALSNGTFARGEVIQTRPKEVEAAVKALIESARALQGNEQVAIAAAEKLGLSPDVVPETYDRLLKAPIYYYGVDGGLNMTAISSTIQLLKDSGDIDKSSALTAAQIVDARFVDQAVKELGPYQK